MAAIGVLTLEIRVENAHSLKEKRHVVKSLKDRLRHKYNVAVAEIDYQDLWQQALNRRRNRIGRPSPWGARVADRGEGSRHVTRPPIGRRCRGMDVKRTGLSRPGFRMSDFGFQRPHTAAVSADYTRNLKSEI